MYFFENDAYYHFRQVMYMLQYWPRTMPFDVRTNFPNIIAVGQFGTLFDPLVATAALLAGLGSSSHDLFLMTLLFPPVVFVARIAVSLRTPTIQT